VNFVTHDIDEKNLLKNIIAHVEAVCYDDCIVKLHMILMKNL